jgi:hypothetical protein
MMGHSVRNKYGEVIGFVMPDRGLFTPWTVGYDFRGQMSRRCLPPTITEVEAVSAIHEDYRNIYTYEQWLAEFGDGTVATKGE